MATHSSVLAWRIPGTGEPGGLPSMGSHRVEHDWSDLAAAAAAVAAVDTSVFDIQGEPLGHVVSVQFGGGENGNQVQPQGQSIIKHASIMNPSKASAHQSPGEHPGLIILPVNCQAAVPGLEHFLRTLKALPLEPS